MTEIRPQGIIAQMKYIIGLALSVIAILGFLSGPINEKQVVFSPKEMTSESTRLEFTFANNSLYPIKNEIFVKGVYRQNGNNWDELEFDEEVNSIIMIYPSYAARYIFPTETYNCSISVHSLFDKETLEPGTYKFVVEYVYQYNEHMLNSSKTLTGTASCEFVIK